MTWHKLLSILVMLALIGACAKQIPPPIPEGPEMPPEPVVTASPPETTEKPAIEEAVKKAPRKDEDVFRQGIALLGEAMTSNRYDGARSIFDRIIKDYPQSKWYDASFAFLRLIDKMEFYRDSLRSQDATVNQISLDKAKVVQENERLKKEIRAVNEKFQSEMTSLQQENEQLKKDIQLLKNLEIQLDKREKMLR